MDSESPAQRLARRVGREPAPDPDEVEDESDTSLARWLPDGSGPRTLGERLAALRADPGRAGVLALLAVASLVTVLQRVAAVRRQTRPAA